MIKIINGGLGGGKTALALSYIYSLVKNNETKKSIVNDEDFDTEYSKVYTNISGMNTEDFEGRLEFLDFNILSKCAEVMYILLEENRDIPNTDKNLNAFFDDVAQGVDYIDIENEFELKEIRHLYKDIQGFKFNNVLIVIDEFADFFVDKKKHLIKWFNYSRHLFQDMILVQNDLTEVATSYKSNNVVKHFIRAADSSLRLHPQMFKYAFYDKHTQFANSVSVLKNIWVPSWIFTKYDCAKPHNSFPKIYMYAIGAFIVLLFLIYSLVSIFGMFDSSANDENISVAQSDYVENSQTQHAAKSKVKTSDTYLACFTCRADSCIYKNDIFSAERLEFSMKRYEFLFAYEESHNTFHRYCYTTNEEFYNMYNKPVDENLTKGSFSLFG